MPLLHPGAFGMAFAGSRGLHRMMVAIEDAGYIIHPVIGWCYGSGFPKASRLDTQIDAAAGVEREVIGVSTTAAGMTAPIANCAQIHRESWMTGASTRHRHVTNLPPPPPTSPAPGPATATACKP